ncbi:hypothetical protein PUNSTDRAFT_52662 [Punctularia strigosozonata HHB-11173 SS5]|uniref:uncharacterized protein n=1 Tax=Punctularia strigosozonata (strain HHB-11173) TaxID=741275 RepID=UPI0004417CC9|nr:uncharacterized protein PUNSTDRAFT_52662 [Punctularia strigosozonata HHB-11173 SS5]EIN08202.1 hypothetical protein PUNSTDRAFT_52662 [Punctularia strigosozonata HHB-11173 SS5]
MPVYNFTVDDSSPIITYAPAGAWSDSSTADSKLDQYANSTFHATNVSGATASFSFTGTAFYLYGAKRANHDEYTVTVDGSAAIANGFNATDDFQTLLWSATDLENEQHQVVLTDTSTRSDRPYVDIDFVVFTLGDGHPETPFQDTTLDDTAWTNITYGDGWETGSNGLNNDYYNGTFHDTKTQGAAARITFFGECIYLYGATSSNHGNYSVAIDGGAPTSLTGYTGTPTDPGTIFRPQTLLFFASGLAHDTHTLELTNTDTSGAYLDFDRLVTTTWTVATNASSSATVS